MKTRLIPAVAALLVGGALALPSQAATAVPTATYIVTLTDTGVVPSAVAALTQPLGGKVGFVYTHALHGFSVTLPDRGRRRAAHPARRGRRAARPAGGRDDDTGQPAVVRARPHRPARAAAVQLVLLQRRPARG